MLEQKRYDDSLFDVVDAKDYAKLKQIESIYRYGMSHLFRDQLTDMLKLDNKEYKGLIGKKITVKQIRVAIDAHLNFNENEWAGRDEIIKALSGTMGRDKVKSFLIESSEGPTSHYRFRRAKSNKYEYRIRKK